MQKDQKGVGSITRYPAIHRLPRPPRPLIGQTQHIASPNTGLQVSPTRCTLGDVFGITCLNVAACHKGAQDAFAHVGLHLGDHSRVEFSRCVKSYTVWQRLKHPINHTDVKTNEAQFRER